MSISAVAGAKNKLAQSLVLARSATGPFASALASASNALTPTSTTDASQAANQQSYNQSLSNVQSKLNQWFEAAGVDTSQEIQLSLGADGTVQLTSNHPDAVKIQQVLQNHPELSGMLQSLSNSYQQVTPSESAPGTSQFVLTLTGDSATAAMSS